MSYDSTALSWCFLGWPNDLVSLLALCGLAAHRRGPTVFAFGARLALVMSGEAVWSWLGKAGWPIEDPTCGTDQSDKRGIGSLFVCDRGSSARRGDNDDQDADGWL